MFASWRLVFSFSGAGHRRRRGPEQAREDEVMKRRSMRRWLQGALGLWVLAVGLLLVPSPQSARAVLPPPVPAPIDVDGDPDDDYYLRPEPQPPMGALQCARQDDCGDVGEQIGTVSPACGVWVPGQVDTPCQLTPEQTASSSESWVQWGNARVFWLLLVAVGL